MNILQVNTTYAIGSTGKIVELLGRACKANGMNVKFACRGLPEDCPNKDEQTDDVICISSRFDNKLHYVLSRFTMLKGFFSILKTIKFLNKIDSMQIDIIHLHNLHGSYINIPLLFHYIKKKNIPILMTLHDCFIITGGCAHFVSANCVKWKQSCNCCPLKNSFSKSLIDASHVAYELKKKCLNSVKYMLIVVPSQWLADLVKQSCLKDYPVRVINNGIDLSVFKPTSSDFRAKHNIPNDKYILLGVAFGWGKRKGLDVFIELSKRLDFEKYQIVLVGTDENTDKQLPSNIISIHCTKNQKELAEVYTVADLFVNPTREENYPTVNMEAIACGTPVLSFRTGGSPEIPDETCGSVVDCDDIDAMEKEIIRICETKPFTKKACLERAKKYERANMCREYLEAYRELVE